MHTAELESKVQAVPAKAVPAKGRIARHWSVLTVSLQTARAYESAKTEKERQAVLDQFQERICQ